MITDNRIANLVEKLQAAYATRVDPLDLPRTLTQRQIDQYVADTATIAAALSVLRNAASDLAKPREQIAELERKREAYLSKQASLEKEIADAPDWRSLRDGRARDKEYDRQQGLKLQLDMLHQNRLLFAPGQVFEDISSLAARIAELNKKIAQHRAQHDAHLKAAEALLAETVTS